MNVPEIEMLVELVADSNVTEVTIRSGAQRITIRKGSGTRAIKSEIEEPVAQETLSPIGPVTQLITSPMVGVYRHKSNQVVIGDLVKAGDVVGSIESMKLENEVRTDFTGFVVEVLVESDQPVEYGQPLFRIESSVSAG